MKLSDFLKDYTLHDSRIGLILADEANYITLGFKWNIFWNKEWIFE